ncbi:unnamed protein product [Malus baccata var. baccata]
MHHGECSCYQGLQNIELKAVVWKEPDCVMIWMNWFDAEKKSPTSHPNFPPLYHRKNTLKTPPFLKLISAGYTTLAALSSLSPSDLARELKIPESEALEILKVASLDRGLDQPDKNNAIVNGEQNAWEMLHEEVSFPRITTSSDDLDNILGGGINYKEVTEVGLLFSYPIWCNVYDMAIHLIQLAMNVQIPVDLGGLGGKAVYVDTEGSFMVEWALQIAKASVVEMSNYNELLKKNRDCQVEIQPTDILDNIFYFRVCTYTEQIALINYLDKFILEHKDVGIALPY